MALGVSMAMGVLLLFAAAMTKAPIYDEDQYIAAGYLTQSLLPYRDFLYLQPTLHAFVLAGVFKLGGGYYLLTGRLLTFGLSLVSAALLWRLLRRLGAGPALAMVLLLACLTSPFLTSPLGNARNDALPLALLLAGLLLQLGAGGRFWRQAVALLFGLAVEAKVSYLFAAMALGAHALFAPRARLLPVALGTLAAAVPAVLCFAAAPDAFRFAVLDYHLTAPLDWYAQQGMGALLTVPGRLQALLGWWLMGGNITLLILRAGLSAAAIVQRPRFEAPGGLPAALLLGAIVFGFLPRPAWPMYYAAVPPLLACCIAYLHRLAARPADARAMRFLLGFAVSPLVPLLALAAPDVAHLARPTLWAGLEAHRTALAIRDELRLAGRAGGEVATLFPRLVLDASPIRLEFATGPFIFRSRDRYPEPQLARLHAFSSSTFAAAFERDPPAAIERDPPAAIERDPPAAIYAGLYADTWKAPMDQALIRYAEEHGWRLAHADLDGARLWLRP